MFGIEKENPLRTLRCHNNAIVDLRLMTFEDNFTVKRSCAESSSTVTILKNLGKRY